LDPIDDDFVDNRVMGDEIVPYPESTPQPKGAVDNGIMGDEIELYPESSPVSNNLLTPPTTRTRRSQPILNQSDGEDSSSTSSSMGSPTPPQPPQHPADIERVYIASPRKPRVPATQSSSSTTWSSQRSSSTIPSSKPRIPSSRPTIREIKVWIDMVSRLELHLMDLPLTEDGYDALLESVITMAQVHHAMPTLQEMVDNVSGAKVSLSQHEKDALEFLQHNRRLGPSSIPKTIG
ncbi:hypothetical protein DXG01_005882, partial [Tephrocybe rancida]